MGEQVRRHVEKKKKSENFGLGVFDRADSDSGLRFLNREMERPQIEFGLHMSKIKVFKKKEILNLLQNTNR